MISYIPLFGIAYLVFIISSLFGFSNLIFHQDFFNVLLPSGQLHNITYSTVAIFVGIVLLFVEVIKSTKTSVQAVIDHTLSTLVLILYIVTYLTVPWAGNSVFLTFTLFSLLDVILGFIISISSARRDFAMGGH